MFVRIFIYLFIICIQLLTIQLNRVDLQFLWSTLLSGPHSQANPLPLPSTLTNVSSSGKLIIN